MIEAVARLLKDTLQSRWDDALRERAQLNLRSIVPVLDAVLSKVQT
jgi:hypothetical protein